MFYAKIIDNVPVEFPIEEKDLRQTLNYISLPSTILPEMLQGTGFVCVSTAGTVITNNVTHQTVLTGVEPDDNNPGYWKPIFSTMVPELTLNEKRIQAQLARLRQIRVEKFKELDALVARATRETRLGVTPTIPIEDLDHYGQALANITIQDNPFEPLWPNLPG